MATLCHLQKKQDTLGLLRLAREGLALAERLRENDPPAALKIFKLFGLCYESTEDYARARELHEQARAMAEALGDQAGVATECEHLGLCYCSTGDYERALEVHERARAIYEALGDRAGVARAGCNLGSCYESKGDYGRARELCEQARAIYEALGDRAGVATACGILGTCYFSTGDYGRARELFEQARAIFEALGDREGVAMAFSILGLCCLSEGHYVRASELYEQASEIFKALGNRLGVAEVCGYLGVCYLSTGNYARAISYFTDTHVLAEEIHHDLKQARAALGIGVALRLENRANVQGAAGHAAGACELPAPAASALGCAEHPVREAEKWLQAALDLGETKALLHLARLAFDAGEEDVALVQLQKYLSSCVQGQGRRCAWCSQVRSDNVQMLVCARCRIVRFCSEEHQKMAWNGFAPGCSLLDGVHRDICSLLGQWRQRVVKAGEPPEALRAELLAFLRK